VGHVAGGIARGRTTRTGGKGKKAGLLPFSPSLMRSSRIEKGALVALLGIRGAPGIPWLPRHPATATLAVRTREKIDV